MSIPRRLVRLWVERAAAGAAPHAEEHTMRTRNLLHALAIGAACTFAAAAGAGAAAPAEVDGRAVFARLKTLEGSWAAPGADGQRATTRFELTAGGSVLVEHYSNPALPNGGHMMTAYHLDGTALILTHYCIANNQPTLRAARFDPAANEIQFEFVRASNLVEASAGHMRRAMYRL